MRNQLKWGAALGVLIAGGCVSLLFRKDATPPPERLEALDDELVRRKPVGPHFLVESPPPSRFELPGGLSSVPPVAPAESPPTLRPLASIARLETHDPPPPKLLAKYSAGDLDSARTSEWKTELNRSADRVALNQTVEETRHVVVDGDTLESIATRYLGDAALKSDLYEANRELLTDPELLPIGAELSIPRGPVRRQ